jgi:hypothetical protein
MGVMSSHDLTFWIRQSDGVRILLPGIWRSALHGVTFFFLTVLFFRSDTHSRMLDTWIRRSLALRAIEKLKHVHFQEQFEYHIWLPKA